MTHMEPSLALTASARSLQDAEAKRDVEYISQSYYEAESRISLRLGGPREEQIYFWQRYRGVCISNPPALSLSKILNIQADCLTQKSSNLKTTATSLIQLIMPLIESQHISDMGDMSEAARKSIGISR